MKNFDIHKGDFVIEKKITFTYWTTDLQSYSQEEKITKKGVVIEKYKYGVLVDWDRGYIKTELIRFRNFNKNLGVAIPGMDSYTYTRYEKV